MTEFILIVWFLNCGWSCKTHELPTYEPFKNLVDCELELNEWLSFNNKTSGPYRGHQRFFFPGNNYYIQHGGACMEVKHE